MVTAQKAVPVKKHQRATSRNIGSLRALLPFLRPYRALIFFACFMLLLLSMVSLVIPLIVREAVDAYVAGEISELRGYFVLAFGMVAVTAGGGALRFWLVASLGEFVVADIRKAIFTRMISMSPAFHEKLMTGEIISRITTDTTVVQSVISVSIATIIRNILVLLGGTVLLFMSSVKLALILMCIAPFVAVPLYFLGGKLRVLSRSTQDRIAASAGFAAESLSAVHVVQSFTHENDSNTQFSQLTDQSLAAAKRRIMVRALLTFFVTLFTFGGVVVVLLVGVLDVQRGVLSTGVLIQFIVYAVIVAGAVVACSQFWSEIQRAAGATERLVELMSVEDTVLVPANGCAFPKAITGRIAFENVGFAYQTRRETPALKDLNFIIEPGEVIAVVGPSGAGKSTLFQLIQRFYDPDEGRVTIDGCDLAQTDPSNVRKAIALVPQDPFIFAASAAENIRFGAPNAADEEVITAARAASADDFIAAFPDGYASELGERGVMLSGGQKQRLAIARALLRDAPILLLDEATSALDSKNEKIVQDAIERLSADRTTLVIAHRLSTIKKADRIMVLNEGRIVAVGTHNELIADDGIYARLAEMQFSAEN